MGLQESDITETEQQFCQEPHFADIYTLGQQEVKENEGGPSPKTPPWIVVRGIGGLFLDGGSLSASLRVNLFVIRIYYTAKRFIKFSLCQLFIFKISISLSLRFYGPYFPCQSFGPTLIWVQMKAE